MSTEPQNPEYLSYHNYGEFKRQLERAKIYFTKPRELENLLKEEAQKKADAEAAARKVQEEAADKQGQIGKDLEQQKLLQPKDLITRLPNNELQEVLHGHGEFHSSTYQAGSREFETSRLQRPTQKFEYSQRPESSTGLLWKNDLTQRRNRTCYVISS
ncbi:hypothetical protein PVT01_000077200 [Plasmodium vivax]|uniref:Uncharacterized protein n=1 Tax=Plasmodium vivax TaxID=5855 RepID=A0A1G4E4L6_PLAVI|nr:hypothetical protein PVT01_000077200 [Plasmodium vivax]